MYYILLPFGVIIAYSLGRAGFKSGVIPFMGGKTMRRWRGVSWVWVIGLEVRELGAGLWWAVEKRNVLQV